MTSPTSPNLDVLFYPKTIAVIGTSTKRGFVWSSGNAYINGSIKQSYSGKIYPVHPNAETILGYPCYNSVRDIPDDVDLAIIVQIAKDGAAPRPETGMLMVSPALSGVPITRKTSASVPVLVGW